MTIRRTRCFPGEAGGDDGKFPGSAGVPGRQRNCGASVQLKVDALPHHSSTHHQHQLPPGRAPGAKRTVKSRAAMIEPNEVAGRGNGCDAAATGYATASIDGGEKKWPSNPTRANTSLWVFPAAPD